MEQVIKILSENLGMETVISAVIVCILMMVVKKYKPKITPRQEIIVRFLISIVVHLVFTLITKGEYAQIFQNAMSVCGVSLIIGSLLSEKGNGEDVKEIISTFIPDLDEEDFEEIVDVLNREKNDSAEIIIPAVYENSEIQNHNESVSD